MSPRLLVRLMLSWGRLIGKGLSLFTYWDIVYGYPLWCVLLFVIVKLLRGYPVRWCGRVEVLRGWKYMEDESVLILVVGGWLEENVEGPSVTICMGSGFRP